MKYKKVVFTKVSPEESKQNRRFFERHVRRAFVQYLAYSGWFNGVLTDEEIKEAKTGKLPKDLDVHHLIPLSGAQNDDANAFTNLSVIHKSTHLAINRNIFDPQLKDISSMDVGEKRTIWIPVFKPVDAGRIIALRRGQNKAPWRMLKKYPRERD